MAMRLSMWFAEANSTLPAELDGAHPRRSQIHRCLGCGSMSFLSANHRILAYVRQLGTELS